VRALRARCGSPLNPMSKAYYHLIGLGVLVLDQVTKAWVLKTIPFGDGREFTTWFSVIHWRNAGGLFGLMDRLPETARVGIFLLLPVAGIAFLSFLFVKAKKPFELALLSAILGGALGNLVDRIRFGAVVDFLDFHVPGGPSWPAFNVADACLSTGIILFLLITLFKPKEGRAIAPDTD
jgi:signal peptidase II